MITQLENILVPTQAVEKIKYFKRGVAMVENLVTKVENKVTGNPKKKKSFWAKFGTFMMMGGFIVVLIVIVLIIVGVSLLFNLK